MTALETAGDAAQSPPGPGDQPATTPATVPPPVAPPAPAPARMPMTRAATFRAVGAGLGLLGVFLLGFAAYLYGLSGVQEHRSQSVMYATLRYQLSQGTAPTGRTNSGALVPPGTPVAILNIPAIGIRDLVVVEGTSPEDLTLGPGLVRSSPQPGQGGVSEIYGRVATFGAPFGRLSRLRPGDTIKAITSQGIATYRVEALGSSRLQVENPAPNQLILLTAGSAAVPTYDTYVDADLASAAQPEPGDLPAIFSDETPLSGDSGALVLTVLWALALAGISAAATFGVVRWRPWPTYLAATPLVLFVLWNLYENLAALLPNVY
jgi:sortase A